MSQVPVTQVVTHRARRVHVVTSPTCLVPVPASSRSAPYWITLWKNEKNMPSIPWKPFGLNNILPRRFPRQRRGNKRQPIVPLKEWKIVRGDTVRKRVIMFSSVFIPYAKCISIC